MSLARQRTYIETLLIAGMQALNPGLALFGENSDIAPPSNEPWIRMSLTLVDITYPCLGQLHVETDGIFNVQIFTPIGEGSGAASALLDQARKILKDSSLTGIEFLSFGASVGELESDWYTLLLRAEYRAQDED